jgi:RimJ/RimL family protein N-acetyltransferase
MVGVRHCVPFTILGARNDYQGETVRMMQIPTLQTERLSLRMPRMEDWPKYYETMMSQRARFTGGPHVMGAAWGIFCHDVAQWTLMGHGARMLVDRRSGVCIGQVATNHGPLFPEHELGWLVYPDAEGKGYAFEAAKAVRDWGFGRRRLKTLVSGIDPENGRSCAVAKRLARNRTKLRCARI